MSTDGRTDPQTSTAAHQRRPSLYDTDLMAASSLNPSWPITQAVCMMWKDIQAETPTPTHKADPKCKLVHSRLPTLFANSWALEPLAPHNGSVSDVYGLV